MGLGTSPFHGEFCRNILKENTHKCMQGRICQIPIGFKHTILQILDPPKIKHTKYTDISST